MTSPTTRPITSRDERGVVRMVTLVLFVATLLVFVRATGNGFVNYDDPDYVTANDHVQAGLSASGLRWALTAREAANWHPLTWMSHMLDISVFGKSPAGHHFTSVLLHALNAALVFLALRRLSGALWTSALAAALFAVHPLRVESVAWVAERKDVLSATFFFVCLWAYAGYAGGVGGEERGSTVPPTRRHAAYGIVIASCALGLMAKPMLVTLPFVLLLLDVWPLQRFTFGATGKGNVPRLLLEKAPLFAMVAASCMITYSAQQAGGAVTTALPLEARLANAVVSIVRYVGATLWPANLVVLYPHPGSWPAVTVLGSGAAVAGITALAWLQRSQRPWLLVGWFWFVGMLVPVIGLVQVGLQSIADRYTYLPVLGLELMALWTLRVLLVPAAAEGAARQGRGRSGEAWRRMPVIATVLVLAALATLSVRQIGVWKDSFTLFDHAIAREPEGNHMAYNNRGHARFQKGDLESAMADYGKALAINPDNAEANNNIGDALVRQGRPAEAIPHFERALRIRPDLAEAHNNLANALADVGRIDEALRHYQRSLEKRPNDSNTLNNYGAALAMAGRFEDAAARIGESLRISPEYASAHANLGNVLAIRGRREEALGHYEQALRLEPADARTHFNRANVLAELGRHADAVASLQRAVQLSPVNPDAYAALGLGLARLGRRDEALRALQTALQQRPDHPQARAWLQGLTTK